MSVTLLEDRACLRLAGPERCSFIQGLITNDIDSLEAEPAVYAALLTPQGKYLFDFFIVNDGETLVLDCQRTRLGDLVKKLMLYRLRAKVDIIDESARLDVYALWGDDSDVELGFADPRLAALGRRVIMPSDHSPPPGTTAPHVDYDMHRLHLGVPDGSRDMIIDKTLILEANLDALNGVSFTKGCYVGQEITARMRHRGKIRYRLFPVDIEGAMPEPGTPVTAQDRQIGEIRSGMDSRALAYLRLEDLDKGPLMAMASKIRPIIPDWLKPSLAVN